jgi:hypothetical protein
MSNKLTASKGSVLIVSAVCMLLSGTTFAAAQVLPDDPPGSAFQTRGIDDDNGVVPGSNPWADQRLGSPRQAHASARRGRAAASDHSESPGDSSQWSTSRADHHGQCWYREGGGGHDLSGYWGPCASH